MGGAEPPAAGGSRSLAPRLLPLIGGQLCLHAAMTGLRMAAPLLALHEGHSAVAVGALLALFAAAPFVLALPAGRMADRHGYHRPVGWAVAMAFGGAALAALATLLPPAWHYALLCVAAVLCGGGANFGLIAIQRTAGRLVSDPTGLKRVFSWLGLAPAVSNMVGPVIAGVVIDAAGFGAAFAALALLPLAGLVWARRVAHEAPPPAATTVPGRRASWDLLTAPPMRRLLLVNWLLSSSWDVHSFIVPVLGHERGLNASSIGLILGAFALSVAGVRLAIPLLAHRLREGAVLAGAMLLTATVFAVYPLAHSALPMGACAVVLGLALGAVQPMIMSTLHQITPQARHGEAIALRSMAINLSSALMPLGFGVAGASLGATGVFWLMGAMVGAGAWPARRLATAH
ncbi:MFS transporter [Methylibium sp.]|uniref:MFS transporter n=1 Tax=Methylibium sp. TaxID=2067992 RepID=UPI003D0B7F38